MYTKSLAVWIVVTLINEIGPIYAQSQCPQAEDFIPFARQRTEECLNAFILFGTGDASNLDAVCRDDCGGALYNFYLNPCLDPRNATNIALGCSQNANGDFCLPLATDLANIGQPFFNACGLLIADLVEDCSTECAAALVSISELLGCCSTNLDLFRNPDYGVASGLNPFFNNQIFFMCEVEPPSECANPFFEGK